MELKAPTVLCIWTSRHKMNVAKLLSNVKFEVRENTENKYRSKGIVDLRLSSRL